MRKTLIALIILGLLWAGPVSAGRVRLVVMDGINLQHLDDAKLINFQFLLSHGAVGLANANTAGGRSSENTAITLGSGSRALGPGAEIVLHSQDSLEASLVGQVHARRTGILPPPGALVVPSIARIQEANSNLLYTVRVGYLAATLAAGGITSAAIVNADGVDIQRSSAAIVADDNGVISAGQTGEAMLIREESLPFGVVSDYAAYAKGLADLNYAELLVIDLGDTTRAQDYRTHAIPERTDVFRAEALIQLDKFLGLLLEQHEEGDLLLVIGLQADGTLGEEEGKWLVPILAYGGDFEPGLLSSPTTRRHGLIANYDVTATILDYFDLFQPGDIHGQPMYSVAHSSPYASLRVREEEMARIYRLRTPLVKGLIAIIIILVGLSLTALFLKWQRLGLLKAALAAVIASPLALLLLGLIPGSSWMVPVWIGLTAAIALVAAKIKPGRFMPVLGAVTALAVSLDSISGAWLQQRSILGYDAIAGARYYGIGNEYMGVLLGSTLLAASTLLDRRKGAAAAIFATVVLLLMLPGVGANFGGTLAAVVGFSIALTGSSIFRNKKHRIIAVFSLLVVAAALFAFNLAGGSHIGRFLSLVISDPGEFWLAVQRKLAMSWRLVRWSLWSRAFAVLLVAALCLLIANRRKLVKKFGSLWPQVRGSMAGALAALVLNDSGIVAAATTLLYLTLPLLYYEFSSNSRVSDSHSV